MHLPVMSQPLPEKPRRSRRRHRRDARPPAQTPGTGVYTGEQLVPEVKIHVFDYGNGEVREREVRDGAQCVRFEGNDSPVWVSVTGLHETDRIRGLLEAYHVHPLVQDDILNTNQGPKVEDFGDYLFITVNLLTVRPELGDDRFEVQHFSLILTKRVLLSFQEAPTPVFDPVVLRLRQGKGRLRQQGPDYLAWALVDALLDHYLVALDDLEEVVAKLDEALTLPDAQVDLHEIHRIRSQTNFIYRTIRPIREVAVALQHSENDLISDSLTPFLRDLYDHSWRAIEMADHLRESVTSIREYHHAVLSQRMNEIMKVLAAISTIFLPLTFVAGIYGMNFENMPELKAGWGYPMVWGVFLLLGFGMIYYFRRRRWL
jgi:magnesium transporter